MKSYQEMSKNELLEQKEFLLRKYKEYQDCDLSLNMARGKPAPAQLDILNIKSKLVDEDGVD